MKKQLRIVVAAVCAFAMVGAFALIGCSSNGGSTEQKSDSVAEQSADNNKEQVELQVFAANSLSKAMEEVQAAYIADGHHRAASAARVCRELREDAGDALTGDEPYNYLLCVLFPASELTVLPYNRVVSDLNGMTPDELAQAVAAANFEVSEPLGEAVAPAQKGVFGMYCAGSWHRLVWKGDAEADADPVASLDASRLQDHVLGPVLGIGDPRLDERISFVGGNAGTEELERRAGADGVAFSLCATSVDDLMSVADAGLLMPPKSTWFEPKLRSGLFIRKISDPR